MSSSKSTSGNIYSKEGSLALKGIAILMLLLHHSFRDTSLYKGYKISFFPFPEHFIVNLALTGKICVCLFAFISGYGLFLSFNNSKTTPTRWAISRYIKTFSGFWFVYIVSAIVNIIVKNRFSGIYFKKGIVIGAANVVLDFFGLANLFNTATMNGTWWYMSAAFVFILLIVLFHRSISEKPLILLLASLVLLRVILVRVKGGQFTGHRTAYAYIPAFISGAMFAKYDLFNKWVNISNRGWVKALKCIAEILVLGVFAKMYIKLPLSDYWEFHFCVVPVVFIMFCVEFITPIPGVRSVLVYLGKHSMNIFLTHTFIRWIFLKDLTYSFRHFALILVFLLASSLAVSIVLEFLKKYTKYNHLMDKLAGIVEKKEQESLTKA